VICVYACILVKAVPTRMEKIAEEIRKMGEVRKTYMTYGRWDIIALVEIPSYDKIREISGRINSIEGVRSTETLSEA